MVFRSRISVGLAVFMTAIIGVCFVTTLPAGILPAILTLGPVVLLIAVLMTSLRYVIDGNTLYVRTIPFTRGTAYDLQKLQSISPTRTLLSSPAWSMRRIKLDFGVGMPLVISPAAQDLFIDEIRRINPNVKINF